MSESNVNPAPSLEDDAHREAERVRQTSTPGGSQENTTAAASPNITVNIGGQPRTFGSQAELQSYFDAMSVRQPAPEPAREVPGDRVTASQQTRINLPKIDVKEFVRDLEKNPAEALWNVESAMYGGVHPMQIMQGMAARIAAAEQLNNITLFKVQHMHDIDLADTDNSQAIANIMQQSNMPLTLENLETALSAARGRGLIKAKETPAAPVAQPTENTRQQPLAPPVLARRGNSPPVDPMFAADVEEMSADQIERLLAKYSATGQF
jgi:hypothetical protein